MDKRDISREEIEKILLKNPEFLKEHEKTEPEFQMLRQLILLRKKNKITQQKLAEKISMKQSHIARLESGEVRPSLKILKRYASGLGQVVSFNIIPMEKYYKSFQSV